LNEYGNNLAIKIPWWGYSIALPWFVVGWVQTDLNLWYVKGNNQNSTVNKGTIREMLFGIIPLDWSAERTNKFTSKFGFDSSPGSYEEVQGGGSFPQVRYKSAFMTPATAIGASLNTETDFYKDFRYASNQNNLGISLFDKWDISTNINYTHVEFNQQATDFLWGEIHTNRSTAKCSKLCEAYVSGSSTVCSTRTYSLGNTPTGSTISWYASSNLTITSGQGTNTITVSKSGSGSGYVEASINLVGCGTGKIRKNVTVGAPSSYNLSISGNTQLSTNAYGSFSLNTVAGASNYSMSVSRVSGSCTSNCWNIYTNTGRSLGLSFSQAGVYQITGTASTACGTIQTYRYVTVTSGSGGGCQYAMQLTTANPASNDFAYRIIIPIDPCFDPLKTAEMAASKSNSVVIRDSYGNLVVSRILIQDNFLIDLSDQKEGLYLVTVYWNGQILSDRIVKK
jgi:hypothetical protein